MDSGPAGRDNPRPPPLPVLAAHMLCSTVCLSFGALLAPALRSQETAWIPLDGPGAGRLPAALTALPAAARRAFEHPQRPAVLLVRRHAPGPVEQELIELFVADEEALALPDEFVVIGDAFLEAGGTEALALHVEWTREERPAHVATLYVPHAEGALSLWLLTTEELDFETLTDELATLAPAFHTGLDPFQLTRYRGIANDHLVGFSLVFEDRYGARIALTPADGPTAADRVFQDGTREANPDFEGGYPADWSHREHGLTLSYQLIQMDVGLGRKEPYVHWLAGSLQSSLRGDPDDGDVPVELLHAPDARTVVVSDAEVARHYANNRRAPDSGVILETFLPRSPYAQFCRLRYQDDETGEQVFTYMVELRTYPRSRSETITRACVVLLHVRAREVSVLEAVEAGLAFSSEPLERRPPLGP